MAAKNSVPVFKNIKDALKETVRILKSDRKIKSICNSNNNYNASHMIYTKQFESYYNTRIYSTNSNCRLAAINSINDLNLRTPLASIAQASSNCLTSNLSSSSLSLYPTHHFNNNNSYGNDIKITFNSHFNTNYIQRRTTAHDMSSSSSNVPFLISSTSRSIIEMVKVCCYLFIYLFFSVFLLLLLLSFKSTCCFPILPFQEYPCY